MREFIKRHRAYNKHDSRRGVRGRGGARPRLTDSLVVQAARLPTADSAAQRHPNRKGGAHERYGRGLGPRSGPRQAKRRVLSPEQGPTPWGLLDCLEIPSIPSQERHVAAARRVYRERWPPRSGVPGLVLLAVAVAVSHQRQSGSGSGSGDSGPSSGRRGNLRSGRTLARARTLGADLQAAGHLGNLDCLRLR